MEESHVTTIVDEEVEAIVTQDAFTEQFAKTYGTSQSDGVENSCLYVRETMVEEFIEPKEGEFAQPIFEKIKTVFSIYVLKLFISTKREELYDYNKELAEALEQTGAFDALKEMNGEYEILQKFETVLEEKPV